MSEARIVDRDAGDDAVREDLIRVGDCRNAEALQCRIRIDCGCDMRGDPGTGAQNSTPVHSLPSSVQTVADCWMHAPVGTMQAPLAHSASLVQGNPSPVQLPDWMAASESTQVPA